MLPKPPSSKAILPPGLRSHATPRMTPTGSSLHQWNVADEKTLSNVPAREGSRV